MTIFEKIRQPTVEQQDAGYKAFSSYPVDFQVADFPNYGDSIRVTGNNLAFFFVSGVKDPATGQIVDVRLNTSALEKMMETIVRQGGTVEERPVVRLQMDADVFVDSARFVSKYQSLRSEEDRTLRETLLAKEADLIRSFVFGGEVNRLAETVLQKEAERKGLAPLEPSVLERAASDFLERNLILEAVKTDEALQFATWEIVAKKGVFMARQEYKNSTYMVHRPWQLGTDPELTQLAQSGHKSAQQVLEAVAYTRGLSAVALIQRPVTPTTAARIQPSTGADLSKI